MKSLTAFALVLLAAARPAVAADAEPQFSADAIKAHVTFLADDLLEGRETGSRGFDIAARYIAAQFAQYGLKPAGVDGSWFIPINFQVRTIGEGATVTLTGPGGSRQWANGTDVMVRSSALQQDETVGGDLVFVGYGIEEPRLKIDDYAGLDVRGKVVVVLSGYPKGLDSEIGAHLGSNKAEVAAKHGAVGIVGVATLQSEKVQPWARSLRTLYNKGMTWMTPEGKPFVEVPGLWGGVSLNKPVADAVFAGAARSFDAVRAEADKVGGRPKGFALKTQLQVTRHSNWDTLKSPDIAGVIEGSDPQLKHEYVVLMGHADHLGTDPRREGDRIFNGALDNAAGTATLLEVARALGGAAQKPKRSVLIMASTGEEKGLLGADYFAHHPTMPIGSIVGAVDLDMPILLYDFTDITAFGADHSSMGTIVQRAAAKMNVALSPDPMPEEGVFTRSDHYMFVQQGVPAVMLVTGRANGGEAKWKEYLETYYHEPGDDLSLPIDWQAGAKFARLNYLIATEMANGAERPLWLEGDYFGDVFAPAQARAPKR